MVAMVAPARMDARSSVNDSTQGASAPANSLPSDDANLLNLSSLSMYDSPLTPTAGSYSYGVHLSSEASTLAHFSPAPTIHSLSPDILFKIFDLGCSPEHRTWYQARDRYWIMLLASRVCQAWREEAQRALWRIVLVRDETTTRLLLGSWAPKRYRTHSLLLYGSRDLSSSSAEALIKKVGAGGLKYLELSWIERPMMDLKRTLGSPSLDTLETLVIDNTYIGDTNFVHTILRPLPVLHSLRLITPRFHDSTAYQFFHSPSLRDLYYDFRRNTDAANREFHSYFLTVAHQIESFHPPSLDAGLPFYFLPAFALCANLRELTLHGDYREIVPILKSIPSKRLFRLTLRLFHCDSDEAKAFIPAVQGIFDQDVLPGLKTLELKGYRNGITMVDGGLALVERLRGGGIDVILP